MAHSLSAKKRIRQNAKRRSRNRWRKEEIKSAVKAFDDALEDGRTDEAADLLKVCYKKLDKVAAKNTIHRNTAARRKANLARRLNEATAK